MTRPCPICRKPRAEELKPFCSPRCRDRDLARWFSDSYAVPGERVDPAAITREDRADEE